MARNTYQTRNQFFKVSCLLILCFTVFSFFLAKTESFDNYSIPDAFSDIYSKIFDRDIMLKTKIDKEIDMVYVCTGPNRVGQLLVSVKSILMFTDKKIHFHIFMSSNKTAAEINKMKHGILSCAERKFVFSVYYINSSIASNYINSKIKLSTQHLNFKIITFLMLEKETHLKNIIFSDTDVIFFADIKKWFDQFLDFEPTHIMGASPGGFRYLERPHPWPKPMGINSGLIVANLTRWRNVDFFRQLGLVYDKYPIKPGMLEDDQATMNVYLGDHQDQFYHLPCSYGFHVGLDCCTRLPNGSKFEDLRKMVCSSIYETGILGLHGSSQSLGGGYLKDQKGLFFGNALMYDVFRKYNLASDEVLKYWGNVYEKYLKHRKYMESQRPNCDFPGRGVDLLKTLKPSITNSATRWKQMCKPQNL